MKNKDIVTYLYMEQCKYFYFTTLWNYLCTFLF